MNDDCFADEPGSAAGPDAECAKHAKPAADAEYSHCAGGAHCAADAPCAAEAQDKRWLLHYVKKCRNVK